ncbi:MAG: phosphate ABC transporter substrate-binding protein [Oscillatoriales cyanobacterium RM2_1_1]|nr:phosphate ABC transporter substrate-binding protein [Oscillatoriales cyanobacterium SM2_3_0]NJO44202.1 phosphate ABC transporter substrate-binding protein [Oscillatoriales cyanobacterium RM2_1_1]
MAQRSGPPPIVYLLALLLLGGLGYWFFLRKPPQNPGVNAPGTNPATAPTAATPNNSALSTAPPPPPPGGEAFPPPASVPAGTVIRVDGSTSMVTINQNLKAGFQAQFPGTTVETAANGTDNGIQDVLQKTVDVAGASRPLKAEEQGQGLVAVPIASDQIAIVIGANNPYSGGLTASQVYGIFTGQITNWSELGGGDAPIQVLNRPAVSGTHQAFKELVLQGKDFGNTPNITTLPRDETTGMLQQLGQDGIGYATFAQVVNQKTVRVLPIDGTTPEQVSYPYQRELMYVYQSPPSPNTQAFLGYALSPQGQQVIFTGN